MKWLIICAAATATLGVIPLLGLPGAIVLAAGEPACRIVYGASYVAASQNAGSGLWSIVIVITLVWPWAVLPLWSAMNRTRPFLRFWARLLLTAAGMMAWTVLVDLGAAAVIVKSAR